MTVFAFKTAAAAFLLAGTLASPAAAQLADPERGLDLAIAWCSGCHVVAPNEDGADVGPAFDGLGGRSEDELRLWLVEPHPPMPNLDLSGDDIEDLIAHIMEVSGGG